MSVTAGIAKSRALTKFPTAQLKTVIIEYDDKGASSKYTESFVKSKKFMKWAKEHPQVDFLVQLNRGKHPVMRCYFQNGSEHAISLRRKQSSHEVQKVLQNQYQAGGVTKLKFKGSTTWKRKYRTTCQGEWNNMLWYGYQELRKENEIKRKDNLMKDVL